MSLQGSLVKSCQNYTVYTTNKAEEDVSFFPHTAVLTFMLLSPMFNFPLVNTSSVCRIYKECIIQSELVSQQNFHYGAGLLAVLCYCDDMTGVNPLYCWEVATAKLIHWE